MSRVSILLHIIKSDPLSWKEDVGRKSLVCNSLASDKSSPSLIPCINRFISKCSTIPTLTFPEDISVSQYIDSLTSYFLTIQVDPCRCLDLQTFGFHISLLLHQKIHHANGVTVTIQLYNHPDVVEFQKARCVEKWRRQGNQFDHIFIRGD